MCEILVAEQWHFVIDKPWSLFSVGILQLQIHSQFTLQRNTWSSFRLQGRCSPHPHPPIQWHMENSLAERCGVYLLFRSCRTVCVWTSLQIDGSATRACVSARCDTFASFFCFFFCILVSACLLVCDLLLEDIYIYICSSFVFAVAGVPSWWWTCRSWESIHVQQHLRRGFPLRQDQGHSPGEDQPGLWTETSVWNQKLNLFWWKKWQAGKFWSKDKLKLAKKEKNCART